MIGDGPRISEDDVVAGELADGRRTLAYLVVCESTQYIAIMDVLDASITDLTPAEIGRRLAASGTALDEHVLQARLDKLHKWGAVHARTDTSRILRHADLLARNWRYTPTPAGRHVQRFYKKVLAGSPAVREIPLSSLARVVEAAEALVSTTTQQAILELAGRLFVNHDDLDAALVGAEDGLADLVDRFDLDDSATAELKTLLVGYATHVASELDDGSARAYRALASVRPRFAEFAAAAVQGSEARVLIERGALTASRGGKVEDWEGLLGWFDRATGRAARFGMRLVRALPGMHVNLRRLHSSSGTATSRSRALALAKACLDPVQGTAVLLAALGDHPWRKLYGEADDADLNRLPSWRDGPQVEVPELLRLTGRGGARGRTPAARDETQARQEVAARRERRKADHEAAIAEVLAAAPRAALSERAARVALVALTAAARSSRRTDGSRTASRDGLACTIFYVGDGAGVLSAPTWHVLTPDRSFLFHRPGAVMSSPVPGPSPDPEEVAPMSLVAGIK